MTASAQWGSRSIALDEPAGTAKPVSGNVKQDCRAVRARPRPALPAPLPPAPVPPAPGLPAVASPQAPRPGRVVALSATVIVTLSVVAGLSWLGQGTDSAMPGRTAVVRVGAGETVWDVAARVAPRSDPRAVVERIVQLNGLRDAEVVPDQQLQVPDGR
ncbi:MAG: LysM peptidoglycan-binding domain-containing protein [Actinomycetota bacterium]|nr:LysM peptidoglycan-binding domain-containing protein [Actinomycetota bacterium]